MPVPSNQIEVIFVIILPFDGTFVICFVFHIEIERKCGWIIGGEGGGAKGMLASSQIIGVGGGGWPPTSYTYAVWLSFVLLCQES